jgi:hypothetical protein
MQHFQPDIHHSLINTKKRNNMKKKFVTGFAVIIGFLTLPGCEIDENKDWTEDVMLTVSSEMVRYYPMMSGNGPGFKGMSVKEDNGDHWMELPLSDIEGFNYEAGYECRLKVQKTHLANPPADAKNITYKLLKVVSKKKVILKTEEAEVYVIGSYPCAEATLEKDSIISGFYYLATSNGKDTLVCALFPEEQFRIPTNYFNTKKDAVAFSDEYANTYKLKITYTNVPEEKKTFLYCPAVTNLSTCFTNNYPEILIKSALRVE